MGTKTDRQLSSAIKFIYEIQDIQIPDDCPDCDREVLESYRDTRMRRAIDTFATELMLSHKSRAASLGIPATNVGYEGYVELAGKLAVLLVRLERRR